MHSYVFYFSELCLFMNFYLRIFMSLCERACVRASCVRARASSIYILNVFQTDLYSHESKIITNIRRISYYRLDKIYAIAQKHGSFGKYTGFCNMHTDKFVYIWCPLYINVPINIDLLSKELQVHVFDVAKTNLACNGLKIVLL